MKKLVKSTIMIGKNQVGGDNPCYIVAEIGINFDGKFNQAIKLIEVAAKAGCNAVKFQLFKVEYMYPENAGKYRVASGEEQDIKTIIKDGELPHNWIKKLKVHAESLGLDFFSSVCDEKSADVLESFDPPAYKIASYELTHLPLLRHVAQKKAPMIISTGGATLEEVAEAIKTIKDEGKQEIVLMHCIAKYPSPLAKANLNIITMFQLAFPDLIIGYSDHTTEPIEGPTTAVILGAKVIEKHITLDKKLSGPDHLFALNPQELKKMVVAIREVETKMNKNEPVKIYPTVLGTSERKTFPIEKYVRKFAYRGIFSIKAIKKGECFSHINSAVLRPGEKINGLHPRYFSLLTDAYKATKDIPAYQGISWEDILQK